ncbi:MAG: TIGR04552 family protein [Deltaproteobacteria bacterium]|nr:TIGR04552 family protein [Deltaproteobacteria bacterium]
MVERSTTGNGSPPHDRLEGVTLGDLEALRLLLRGGSVVDWHRLDLRDEQEVDRFLRVNEFQPTSDQDMQRIEHLRSEAVDFLRRSLGFRIPEDVADDLPARDLFLLAARKGRRQVHACFVLKTMHIIHHLAGRELLFRLPISDDEVFHLVERKVVTLVEEIRAAGHPIVEFEWSRKPRDSLITKLLAKKSTLAANVYDKLRFRLVVRDRDAIPPLLIELLHRLIPFNYVVPGESVNDIVPFRKMVEDSPHLSPLGHLLQEDIGNEEREDERKKRLNEFSGPGYRIINFVADMPVRLDNFLCRVQDPSNLEFGVIAFVLTEFQVVDLRTARENEAGENSHDKYKERQLARVRTRLLRGLREE